jgi:hypothetical protein
VVHNEGGVAPCCGTYFPTDDVGHLAAVPGEAGATRYAEVWNGERMRQARALFRDRAAPDAPRDHVCYDCPLTVIWERWQQHQASGAREPFEAGYSTNDCFNYFWNRRPTADATAAVPRRA